MAGPPELISATGATDPWGIAGMELQSTGAALSGVGATGFGFVAGLSQM
jgi:hypothetical protein